MGNRFNLGYFIHVLKEASYTIDEYFDEYNEWVVIVPLMNPQFRLKIRTSVCCYSDLSNPLNEDSIRIFLERKYSTDKWEFIKQHEYWTQRREGWEKRLIKKMNKISSIWNYVRYVEDREDCGIRVNAPDPSNNGRAYAIYFDLQHPFGKLTYLSPKPSGSKGGRRLSRPTKGSQTTGLQ